MKILALAGSYRVGSLNRKLLALAVQQARAKGAEVDVVDLKTLALPVYDGDVEDQGFPAAATELKTRLQAAQGLLICTPEYNASIPGGLKNAIDWASRPPTTPFKGKLVAILGASTGMLGTVRAQGHLRQTLITLGAWVLPTSMLLPKAQDAFDEHGELKEALPKKNLAGLVETFLSELQRWKA